MVIHQILDYLLCKHGNSGNDKTQYSYGITEWERNESGKDCSEQIKKKKYTKADKIIPKACQIPCIFEHDINIINRD